MRKTAVRRVRSSFLVPYRTLAAQKRRHERKQRTAPQSSCRALILIALIGRARVQQL